MSASSPRIWLIVLGSAVALSWLGALEGGDEEPVAEPQGLVAMPDEEEPVELALLMADLQRLTHKLALSADAGNVRLASFYLHEIGVQLQKIQTEAPDYEGLPIAVLVDRMAAPVLDSFRALLDGEEKPDRRKMLRGLDALVQSCNACHAATQHDFIRITRGTEVNPFNQSFAP
jgi:hypothetical protein